MRDTAGELANSVQPLRMRQLFFGSTALYRRRQQAGNRLQEIHLAFVETARRGGQYKQKAQRLLPDEKRNQRYIVKSRSGKICADRLGRTVLHHVGRDHVVFPRVEGTPNGIGVPENGGNRAGSLLGKPGGGAYMERAVPPVGCENGGRGQFQCRHRQLEDPPDRQFVIGGLQCQPAYQRDVAVPLRAFERLPHAPGFGNIAH